MHKSVLPVIVTGGTGPIVVTVINSVSLAAHPAVVVALTVYNVVESGIIDTGFCPLTFF